MASLLMTGFPGSWAPPCSPACSPGARTCGPSAWCSPGTWRRRGNGSASWRPSHPDVARPDRARRPVTSPHPTSASARAGSAPSRTSRRSGTSRRSTTWPSLRETARRVNVDGTARVLDLCRSLPRLRPPALRQHLLRQRPLRGRVHRGRPRRGPALPQPLRVDQVRGRAAGPQGDGRRPAGDHLPPRHRRRRLPHRGDPEVRRPLLPRRLPATAAFPVALVPPARRSGRGPRSAWCRATSSSTRWTSSPCWTGRSAGPTR